MYSKREIGSIGENLATKYLESLGYHILDRNFKAKQGEIDIIAVDRNVLIFVEVKTRTNGAYGRPIDAINKVKQKHIKETTKFYIYKNNLQDYYVRVDAIEVYDTGKKAIINHIKNIV